MSSNSLRREVLKSFKSLHRTCMNVFQNHKTILSKVKKEINDTYKKNKNVNATDSIKDLITFARNVEYEIKTTVCEFERTGPNVYRLKLRPEMFEEASNPPKN